jgi:ABC-type antimicrobial peptide transport system permease subunit
MTIRRPISVPLLLVEVLFVGTSLLVALLATSYLSPIGYLGKTLLYLLIELILAGGLFVVGLSLVLLVWLLLQVAGVVKGVPFRYNWRNLIVRWKTTFLTALAFTLVVALMTVMLAFVNGMYKLTEGSGHPENVMVMSDGSTDEAFSNLGFRDVSEVEWHPAILRGTDNRPLVSWEVYLIVNQPIPGAEGGRKRRFLQVRGLDDPLRSGLVHGMGLHPGGAWFSGAGVQHVAESGSIVLQANLGEGIARELGRDQGKESLEVGDIFEVGPQRWIVSGILQSAGSTFDSEIWAKKQIVAPLFGKESYTTIVLRTADARTAKETAQDLKFNYKKSAIQAIVETEYYDKLNGTNQQFLVAIIFVAVVMAVGGIFGVMNTMYAAISQRTQDIGVMRILGFSRWQVLMSFFLESLLIALVGGLIGIGLGSLADGWTASSVVGSGQGGGKSVMLKLIVDGKILMTGLLFSLAMGCVGGLLPALSAMRLKPLDAVR